MVDCEPRYRQDAKTQRITKISIPWERHASHLHHKDTKTRRFHTGKNVVDLRVFVVRFFGCGCCRGQRNGLDLGVCVVDAALAVQLESQPSLVGQFQPVRFRDVFPIHPDTGVGAVGYETHQAPLAITAGQVAGTDYTVNAAGRVGRAGNTIDLDFITAAGPRTPIQSSPVRMSGSKVRLELERAEILMNETTDEHR